MNPSISHLHITSKSPLTIQTLADKVDNEVKFHEVPNYQYVYTWQINRASMFMFNCRLY